MKRPPPWLMIAVITAMTAISSASNSQYLPSLPAIGHDLATTPAMVQLTLSLFMVFYALAQLVWGPLSDRYGRRPILIAGLGLYIATSLACWMAPTIEALIAFRIAQAMAAACPPVIARAVVRDLYELKDAARVMAYVTASFSLAPVLAPMVGALLEQHFGWRSNFMFMVLFGTAIACAVVAILPETRRPSRAPIDPLGVVASYGALITSRMFLGYTLCISFAFGCIFVFNSVAPFWFIEAGHMTPPEFALAYGTVTVGYGGSSYLASRVTPRLGIDRTILMGIVHLPRRCGGAVRRATVFGGYRRHRRGSAPRWWWSGSASGFIFPERAGRRDRALPGEGRLRLGFDRVHADGRGGGRRHHRHPRLSRHGDTACRRRARARHRHDHLLLVAGAAEARRTNLNTRLSPPGA